MKYSELKAIREFCDDLTSQPDWREVAACIGEDDFEVNNVRFIESDEIDEIQEKELGSDLYILGCFNASFLSSILEIDCEAIEAMQEAEAFEAVGKLIVSMDKLSEVQQGYASADGYGHHFNRYDFSEEELTVGGYTYHVFDNR